MEAKDGSMGFDFAGTYTKIVKHELIEYSLEDDRLVQIEFAAGHNGVTVRETFEAESTHSVEQQPWRGALKLRNAARSSFMKPRITILTIGVDELERAVQFYRDGLGLPTQDIIGKEFEYGAVAFFDLESGLKLAVWPRKSLGHDTGIPVSSPSPTEFSIGHNNARSR